MAITGRVALLVGGYLQNLTMSPYEHWSLFWTATSAIATAVTCAVVIVAAILAYKQVSEASRARKLESALAVLTHISSPELRNARRLVYTHQKEIRDVGKTNPSWDALDEFFKRTSNSQVDMACFHSYLASLENVSILVLHDLAPDEIIEMYFARFAPYHWNALGEFIAFMRRTYGSNDFLQHFEMLNTLLTEDGLDVQRGFLARLLPNRRSARIKRRLLSMKRLQRKAENSAANNIAEIEDKEI